MIPEAIQYLKNKGTPENVISECVKILEEAERLANDRIARGWTRKDFAAVFALELGFGPEAADCMIKAIDQKYSIGRN